MITLERSPSRLERAFEELLLRAKIWELVPPGPVHPTLSPLCIAFVYNLNIRFELCETVLITRFETW